MSRQTSKQMAKKICHDNISSVATQRTEYKRGVMSQQKTACRDRTWEECNKLAETKKINVAIRFVSWMSTPRRTYRYIKVHVATLETGRKQTFCRDKKLKSNTGRTLRHIGLCCDIMKNIRQNLCRDRIFSCRNTNYCNLEKPVETKRISRRKTSIATRQSMSRHCMKKFCHDKVMNVATLKDNFWS